MSLSQPILNNKTTEESKICSQIFDSEMSMQKKYTGLLILLSDVHKKGNETVKCYAVHLAKLLGNVINISENIILTELKAELEHVLLCYMPVTRFLLAGGTYEAEDATELSRIQLLKDINAMVRDQMEYGDKLQMAKNIMMLVSA
jgi:hypothetical protein